MTKGSAEKALIRQMAHEDIPEALRLLSSASELAVLEGDTWNASELAAWRDAEPSGCIVAVIEARLVGICLTHLHVEANKLHVEDLVVEPAFRRRGIGSALFAAARDAALQRTPTVRCVALVKSANLVGQKAFSQMGFANGPDVRWRQCDGC